MGRFLLEPFHVNNKRQLKLRNKTTINKLQTIPDNVGAIRVKNDYVSSRHVEYETEFLSKEHRIHTLYKTYIVSILDETLHQLIK